MEDKIVPHAVVKILNEVYENDFLGFSYGFRPGRSQHQALDALTVGITRKRVNWVLDYLEAFGCSLRKIRTGHFEQIRWEERLV